MKSAAWMHEMALATRKPGWLRQCLLRLTSGFHIPRTPRVLRVIETLQIGEKRQLLIVSIGQRHLLIGAAGNFVAMLAELPAEKELGAQ